MSPARREEHLEGPDGTEGTVKNQPSLHGAHHACFACGGPIYVPDLVSPITTVVDFQATVAHELHNLEMELHDATDFDREISVDELKVFTEEELVEKALADDLEDSDEATNTADSRGSIGAPISSIEAREKKRKKRGRVFDRDARAAALEGDYFAKADQLAEVLQRQNEDKAAARLHSFNGSSPMAEDGVVAASEKTERMQSLRFISTPLKVSPAITTENLPVTYPEVVLAVEVYSRKETLKKTQEFLVLGRQKLTELRDHIYCLTDELMRKVGQDDRSGYFLIEDFICNDLRDPSATDYSEPILEWLTRSRSEAEEKWEYIMSGELKQKQKELLGNGRFCSLPNLKAIDMHKTRFCDLRFRLGSGYLYCHQGDCKHVIVIRDMRMINPEDNQNMAAYPLRTFQMKLRHRKCSVCDICIAKKMTVDDKWAQKNPCYFCDNCYFLLHYSKDGSLLYDDFTVYDYYHE